VLKLRLEDAAQVVLVIRNEDLFVFAHGPECSARGAGVQTVRDCV
jgi:hypothetical protein